MYILVTAHFFNARQLRILLRVFWHLRELMQHVFSIIPDHSINTFLNISHIVRAVNDLYETIMFLSHKNIYTVQ